MAAVSNDAWEGDPEEFRRAMAEMSEQDFADYLDALPEPALAALMRETSSMDTSVPINPLEQAIELNPKYRSRPHLEYLADRIALAVEDVKAGKSRQIAVSMPPRSGKSELISKNLPVWLLRQNPSWKLILMSYSPTLAAQWSRDVRRAIEEHGPMLGLAVAPDAGAVGDWETTAKGEVHARSMGQGVTGQGANVLIIDDPIKDYATAHSATKRDALWENWTANISSRREPPSLTIVVQTRWHEDDFTGRLLSEEYPGDPADWEVISFPAIADHDPSKGEQDVIGREVGDPLYPPLIEMDRDKALGWWGAIKKSISSYTWAALYQQRPSPASGAIFNTDWWRYWTRRPDLVSRNEDGTEDGKVILLPDLSGARLLDSWDLNYDDTEGADFVVGQRWAFGTKERRFLLDQRRGRWDFPRTIEEFEDFNSDRKVFEHLVEKKANGAAMIKMLASKFSGFKPVNPQGSKEVRARAVTAEVESGHVYLPHPLEHAWVEELLTETREFPSGAHDDMVDSMTQALDAMRGSNETAGFSNPAKLAGNFRQGPARTLGATRPGSTPLTAARVDRRYTRR